MVPPREGSGGISESPPARRPSRRAVALGLAGALALAASFSPPARGESANASIGIVLLHGKLGVPLGQPNPAEPAIGALLVKSLDQAGYRIATPELCWSRSRGFDRSRDECLGDIDRAIADLRAQGASAIVVAGMSLGGNVAIAYGASHPDLLGVIAFSPADDPGLKRNRRFGASLGAAQSLVAQGRGDEKSTFDDANTGAQGSYPITITTTPRIFLSFAGTEMSLPANAAKLRVPLLWVAGDDDPTQASGRAYAFDRAPPNPMSRYLVVHANHIEAPDAATPAVLEWLAELKRGQARPISHPDKFEQFR